MRDKLLHKFAPIKLARYDNWIVCGLILMTYDGYIIDINKPINSSLVLFQLNSSGGMFGINQYINKWCGLSMPWSRWTQDQRYNLRECNNLDKIFYPTEGDVNLIRLKIKEYAENL